MNLLWIEESFGKKDEFRSTFVEKQTHHKGPGRDLRKREETGGEVFVQQRKERIIIREK